MKELLANVGFDLSPDGYTIRAVAEGEVFEAPDDLARALIRDGLAIDATPAPAPVVAEGEVEKPSRERGD